MVVGSSVELAVKESPNATSLPGPLPGVGAEPQAAPKVANAIKAAAILIERPVTSFMIPLVLRLGGPHLMRKLTLDTIRSHWNAS